MRHIRPVEERDISRIAEILVFNNRLNFFPIFQDESYSFGELQVLPVAERYRGDRETLKRTCVYDDGVVKGFITIRGREVEKLFVDPCFQGRGIGGELLRYAVERYHVTCLWALEKNTRGRAFYAAHGFLPNGRWKYEEGTAQRLLLLERETS